jgi:hypothetical protein
MSKNKPFFINFMKKIFLSAFLFCAFTNSVFAQKKVLQAEKQITHKTQDDLVTREELSAIKKNALAKGKNQQEVANIMDEEYKQLIAKKQADIINAQATQIAPTTEIAERKLETKKILSKEQSKDNNEKLAVVRAEYEKKRAELSHDINKKRFSTISEKQNLVKQEEEKLKSQYPMLFSDKN